MKFEGDTNIQSTTPSFPEPSGLDKREDWSARPHPEMKSLQAGSQNQAAGEGCCAGHESALFRPATQGAYFMEGPSCLSPLEPLPRSGQGHISPEGGGCSSQWLRTAAVQRPLILPRCGVPPMVDFSSRLSTVRLEISWHYTALWECSFPSPSTSVWPDWGLKALLSFSCFLADDWLSYLIPSWHLLLGRPKRIQLSLCHTCYKRGLGPELAGAQYDFGNCFFPSRCLY